MSLDEALVEAVQGNGIAKSRWPENVLNAAEVGLVSRGQPGAPAHDELIWSLAPDVLQPSVLAAELPALNITHFHSIDSTNTYLMERVAAAAGHLCVAELQIGGRGRRGRHWLSPYGRNLAMSLGHATQRDLADLGGLSLVVGVALTRELMQLGVQDAALKWPNDILVSNRKLCGILVELARRDTQGSEAIIGMGINVALTAADRAQIDQPVADLRESGVVETRTQLVVRLITAVLRALERFEREGFGGFIDAFNAMHALQGQDCVVIQGSQRVTGRVAGVGAAGELLLDTAGGQLPFHGGEVSLRATAQK